MIGKLSQVEIDQFLHEHLIGRIGCYADGLTYVVPTSYAYDGTNIYALSPEGMKVQMMRKNPHVCFEVDDTRNMGNWKSVIAWGLFREIREINQRKDALQKLVDRKLPITSSETTHLTPQWPFTVEDLNSIKGVVFSIKLFERTGRFETNSATATMVG
jgi:uncharacterized protein